jgi:hypothetical protein
LVPATPDEGVNDGFLGLFAALGTGSGTGMGVNAQVLRRGYLPRPIERIWVEVRPARSNDVPVLEEGNDDPVPVRTAAESGSRLRWRLFWRRMAARVFSRSCSRRSARSLRSASHALPPPAPPQPEPAARVPPGSRHSGSGGRGGSGRVLGSRSPAAPWRRKHTLSMVAGHARTCGLPIGSLRDRGEFRVARARGSALGGFRAERRQSSRSNCSICGVSWAESNRPSHFRIRGRCAVHEVRRTVSTVRHLILRVQLRQLPLAPRLSCRS